MSCLDILFCRPCYGRSGKSQEYKGATEYPKDFKTYDFFTYQINVRFGWGLTLQRILKHYRKFVSQKSHAEVGLATPTLVSQVVSKDAKITLLDVSDTFLEKSEFWMRDLGYSKVTGYHQDITTPVDPKIPKVDSICLNYVLHCVPGTLAPSSKGVCFQHIKGVLAPGGVCFGTTVLGYNAGHNCFGRWMMGQLNGPKLKVFTNTEDSEADLRASLTAAFKRFELKVYGVSAVWAATDDPSRDLTLVL